MKPKDIKAESADAKAVLDDVRDNLLEAVRKAGVKVKDGASVLDAAHAAVRVITSQRRNMDAIRKSMHDVLKGLAAVEKGAEKAQDAARKSAHTAAAWAVKR